MKIEKWSNRVFTSLLTAVGFVLMVLSGLVAYIVPHGRVAYWTDWRLLGLSKNQWGDIHILAGILFLIAACFHIYFNWNPLLRHISSRVQQGAKLKSELFTALLIGLLVVIGGISQIPPLNYLLDLNGYIKRAWVPTKESEPPFGHAELLSLKALCGKQKIPVDQAVAELKAKGIKLGSGELSLAEIAQNNRQSPMEVYSVIQHLEPQIAPPPSEEQLTPRMVEEKFAGSGIGRKSLSDVTTAMGLDLRKTRVRLEKMGIVVREDESLKTAAIRNNLFPIEILKAILVKGYQPKR